MNKHLNARSTGLTPLAIGSRFHHEAIWLLQQKLLGHQQDTKIKEITLFTLFTLFTEITLFFHPPFLNRMSILPSPIVQKSGRIRPNQTMGP